MEDRFEEKLNEYICCYCADKTSDLDFAIGQLSTAIGTFEREAKKRKEKKQEQLIRNFMAAYNELKKADIDISVNICSDELPISVNEKTIVKIDNFKRFYFITRGK